MATKIDARVIESLIERHKEISHFLDDHKEITLRDYADGEFRKVLVLSIASFFEQQITDAVASLAASTNSKPVENLIRRKANSRQYHTYFNWEGKNANAFLGLFGDEFKDEVGQEIRSNPSLDEGCKSFLQLGLERNSLVHSNFASAPMDRTLEEIQDSFGKALDFIDYLSKRIQPQQ